MLVHNIGGTGYQQSLYNGTSAVTGKQKADAIFTNAQNPIQADDVEITKSEDVKNSGKGKTLLKVLGGVIGAGAIAALAIFGKKGDLFSKAQKAFSSAEGSNVFAKIKNLATKGNAEKAFDALKKGAKSTYSEIAPKARDIIDKAAKKATPVVDAVKDKAEKIKGKFANN